MATFEIPDGSAARVIAAFGSVEAAVAWVGQQLETYTLARERALAMAALAEAQAALAEPEPLTVTVTAI